MLLATDLYSRDVKDNTETTLVRAALNGDADSFGRLCERYYPAMVAIAYSRLSDRDLAQDTAQEAFFVAFRNISKLKKESHFSRWVAGICRNIASDMAMAPQMLARYCDMILKKGTKHVSEEEAMEAVQEDIVSILK